ERDVLRRVVARDVVLRDVGLRDRLLVVGTDARNDDGLLDDRLRLLLLLLFGLLKEKKEKKKRAHFAFPYAGVSRIRFEGLISGRTTRPPLGERWDGISCR